MDMRPQEKEEFSCKENSELPNVGWPAAYAQRRPTAAAAIPADAQKRIPVRSGAAQKAKGWIPAPSARKNAGTEFCRKSSPILLYNL